MPKEEAFHSPFDQMTVVRRTRGRLINGKHFERHWINGETGPFFHPYDARTVAMAHSGEVIPFVESRMAIALRPDMIRFVKELDQAVAERENELNELELVEEEEAAPPVEEEALPEFKAPEKKATKKKAKK